MIYDLGFTEVHSARMQMEDKIRLPDIPHNQSFVGDLLCLILRDTDGSQNWVTRHTSKSKLCGDLCAILADADGRQAYLSLRQTMQHSKRFSYLFVSQYIFSNNFPGHKPSTSAALRMVSMWKL